MKDKDKTKNHCLNELVTSSQQVIELERTEEVLQHSSEYFQVLIENAFDAIATVDRDGIIRYVSPSIKLSLGYEPEEWIGKTLFHIIHPEDLQDVKSNLAVVLQKPNNVVLIEVRMKHKDGSWRTLECIGRNLLDYSLVDGVVVNFHDITDYRQKEKNYRELIEDINDGYFVFQDEKIVLANRRLAQIYGYTIDQVLGKDFLTFLAPEARQEITDFYIRVINGEEEAPRQLELAGIKSDGTRILVEIGVKSIDYDGAPAFSVIVRDITERKHMEENIKHRLRIEQAIASVSRLFTSQADIDINEVLKILGEAVSVNRAYVFKMSDTTEIADNTHEWCSPGTEPQIQNLQGLEAAIFPSWMEKIYAGENIVIPDVDALPAGVAIEKELLQAQDIRSLLIVPIYMLDETLAGCIGFDDTEECRPWSDDDVSLLRVAAEMLSNYWERKQKEGVLRDSERMYKTMVDTASRAGVGIAVVQDKDDKQGKLVFVNQECARISGYTEEELLDLTLMDVIPPRIFQWFRDIYVKRQSGEMVTSFYEAAILTKSGQEKDVEMSVSVTVYGGKLASIAFFRDITERKQAEAELQKSYEREIKLRQALEDERQRRIEFTRVLVHELKTPLTPVLASSQLLAEELRDVTLVKLAQSITHGAWNLSNRIDELLDITKGELGTLHLEFESVDLLPLLHRVAENIAPMASGNGHSLILDLPPSVPLVRADENRLQQVILNLLNNACKFTPRGGRIILRARKENSNLIVEVQDNGNGITEKERQRIFEPYYRVESDRQRLCGLGLGLALCKTVVELHGGQIWVVSCLGEGTTFGFSLPLED